MNGGTVGGSSRYGVSVSGTFHMGGGTISGNNGGGVSVDKNSTLTMRGGTISANTASGTNATGRPAEGGGVYIDWGGIFIKDRGGTIEANNRAADPNTNVIGGFNSRFNRSGAAGPSVNLNSQIAGRLGGWE